MPNVTTSTEELQMLRQSAAERDALRGGLRVVTVERDLLKERVKAFLRQLFAARSEARGTEQKDLFFNEAEVEASTTVAEPTHEDGVGVEVAGHTRKQRGRKPLDPCPSREVVRHELAPSQRICPHDGSTLVEIGAEISEQLDIIPQQVRVIQHHRIKYACPCCDEGIKVTPAPTRIIDRGLLTESALAWIVTDKYQGGLPLYRQATSLRRFKLHRQTRLQQANYGPSGRVGWRRVTDRAIGILAAVQCLARVASQSVTFRKASLAPEVDVVLYAKSDVVRPTIYTVALLRASIVVQIKIALIIFYRQPITLHRHR